MAISIYLIYRHFSWIRNNSEFCYFYLRIRAREWEKEINFQRFGLRWLHLWRHTSLINFFSPFNYLSVRIFLDYQKFHFLMLYAVRFLSEMCPKNIVLVIDFKTAYLECLQLAHTFPITNYLTADFFLSND